MRLLVFAAWAALAGQVAGCSPTYIVLPPPDEAWPARAEPVIKNAANVPSWLDPGQTAGLWSRWMVSGGGRGPSTFTLECKRLDAATELEFLLHFPGVLSPEVMSGGGHV